MKLTEDEVNNLRNSISFYENSKDREGYKLAGLQLTAGWIKCIKELLSDWEEMNFRLNMKE